MYFVSMYCLQSASVTLHLHAIPGFTIASPVSFFISPFFISVPAGQKKKKKKRMRITTAWGPDETDLGVNELLTDRQRSSMHLN